MIVISDDLANARLAAVLNSLDNGTGRARIRIYDGTRPAFGVAGNVLTDVVLDKPCGVVASRILTLHATDAALVLKSGNATWARVINANGDVAFDADVSDQNGIGDIRLSKTTLYEGGEVSVVSAKLR